VPQGFCNIVLALTDDALVVLQGTMVLMFNVLSTIDIPREGLRSSTAA
jgi:hypothetical protein